jgi:hypothetical protein
MKANTLLPRWALAAGLVLVAGACSNPLADINKNPNAPTDVDPQFILPQAIRSAVENTFADFPTLSHTGVWSQHIVEIQYPDEEQGLVRPGNMQGFWDTYYASSLQDIQTVIDKGVASTSPNVEGVGRIWKSYIFHLATDLYGDLPYSEALRADEGISAPVYDAQEDVYTGMLQELTAAAALLDPSESGFGPGDILYGNDFEKWRRFANSLRMRLAMRLSEVDPAAAQAAFVAAYNAGGFQSNADNAMLQWPGAPYQNPYFENWQGRDDHGISKTLVDTLTSLADPRLALYAEPAESDGLYRGCPNGYLSPPSLPACSRIGNFWRADGAATPTAILTYAEVLFLQAEAAQRGWIAGTPAALYEAAIRASMNQYDAWSPANAPTDAEIDAYVAQASVAYTGVEQIHLQKWISLFMNGHEAWSNQRRTDVPALLAGPDLVTTRIPVRFHYPSNEQSLNLANLTAASTRQGCPNVACADLVTTVWWDVN